MLHRQLRLKRRIDALETQLEPIVEKIVRELLADLGILNRENGASAANSEAVAGERLIDGGYSAWASFRPPSASARLMPFP